jgi:hypothetical protein
MMLKRRFVWCVLAAVPLAWMAPCSARAAAVELRLKLEKGKTYYQKTLFEQKMTQTVMGQQQTINQNMGTGMKLDVLDVDSQGNMRIRHTFDWMMTKQAAPMMTVEYDSAKQDKPPAGTEMFAALLGQSYIAKLSPKGEILALEGIEQMREAITKKLPAGSKENPAMGAVSPYLEEKSLREMTENTLGNYPDKPVEIGDSWSRKRNLSLGFWLILDSKWTLQKREAGAALIGATGTMRSDPNSPPMEVSGMKMKFDVAGTYESTLRMDEATGLIALDQGRQQFKGDIKMLGDAQGPPMMTIPIASEITSKLEMSDKPPATK